jgi:hypothetical protein
MKQKTQKNNNALFIIMAIVVVIYGSQQGWFTHTSNGQSNTSTTDYWCCNSNNIYSCNANCGANAKVYTGSFNTLSACNTKCVTPTVFQPVQPAQPNAPTQTCQQIAEGYSASYKNTPVSTAKECMDFAVLDCQDTGKILDGYGVSGTCCYFTCIGIVTPEVNCVDTDNGLSYATFGQCGDSITPYIEDFCMGGELFEQSCVNNKCVATQYHCPNGRVCDFGKCISVS